MVLMEPMNCDQNNNNKKRFSAPATWTESIRHSGEKKTKQISKTNNKNLNLINIREGNGGDS